jgi:hypothetical protein
VTGALGPPTGGFGWDRSFPRPRRSPPQSIGSAREAAELHEEHGASSREEAIAQPTDSPFVGAVALIATFAVALAGGIWRSTLPRARAVVEGEAAMTDRPVSAHGLARSFSKSVVREAQREGAAAMVVGWTEALSKSLDAGDCAAALTAMKGLAACVDLDAEEPPRLTRNIRELRQDVLSACPTKTPAGASVDRTAQRVQGLGATSPD